MTLNLTFYDQPRSKLTIPIKSPYMVSYTRPAGDQITNPKSKLSFKDIQFMTLNLTSWGQPRLKSRSPIESPDMICYMLRIQTKRLSPTINKLFRSKEILTFDLPRVCSCTDFAGPQKLIDSSSYC